MEMSKYEQEPKPFILSIYNKTKNDSNSMSNTVFPLNQTSPSLSANCIAINYQSTNRSHVSAICTHNCLLARSRPLRGASPLTRLSLSGSVCSMCVFH